MRPTLRGGAGSRAEAFAALRWWERVLPEPDASPLVAAQAKLALGQGVQAGDGDEVWLRIASAASALPRER